MYARELLPTYPQRLSIDPCAVVAHVSYCLGRNVRSGWRFAKRFSRPTGNTRESARRNHRADFFAESASITHFDQTMRRSGCGPTEAERPLAIRTSPFLASRLTTRIVSRLDFSARAATIATVESGVLMSEPTMARMLLTRSNATHGGHVWAWRQESTGDADFAAHDKASRDARTHEGVALQESERGAAPRRPRPNRVPAAPQAGWTGDVRVQSWGRLTEAWARPATAAPTEAGS